MKRIINNVLFPYFIVFINCITYLFSVNNIPAGNCNKNNSFYYFTTFLL